LNFWWGGGERGLGTSPKIKVLALYKNNTAWREKTVVRVPLSFTSRTQRPVNPDRPNTKKAAEPSGAHNKPPSLGLLAPQPCGFKRLRECRMGERQNLGGSRISDENKKAAVENYWLSMTGLGTSRIPIPNYWEFLYEIVLHDCFLIWNCLTSSFSFSFAYLLPKVFDGLYYLLYCWMLYLWTMVQSLEQTVLKAVISLQCKNQQHPLQHNPSVLPGFCIIITMCLMANWF
jgi:hypothetical protein